MRTIQYTQLIWAVSLIVVFGIFLLGRQTFHTAYYFIVALIFGVAAISSFRNNKLAWTYSIVFTIYVFIFHGLKVVPGFLPTEANLKSHSEFPMGTMIITLYSLLFLVPPAILFCYYFIHRKSLVALFMDSRP